MKELPQERLIVSTAAIGMIERALRLTIDYVKERKAFGKAVIDFQNTQFELGRVQERGDHRAGIPRPLRRAPYPPRARHRDRLDGEILADRPAEQNRRPLPAIVRRLWLYGRNIRSRACTATRGVQRIYAGTNEIMKLLIGQEFVNAVMACRVRN
jgi:acyl-CoA dehydrogenase